ncbi:MAG TPA: trypsin-like peptidase domain-containing protein, partial [Tepidisphaeraceae bacterium]
LAMRTATSLNKYLDEHPDELDSEILDLFFTALTRAQERVANRATLDAMIQNYEKYNARLEATRPFKKRWGVQWVDQVTFDINMHKLKSGRDNYQRALDRAADAGDEVQAAKAAVAAARLGRGSLPGANNRLARAQDILARRQEEAEEARAKIPPIPTLEKADLARLIQPHEAQVVVAKANDRTHAAAGQAESKPIQFTLGGGGPKTASGGGTTGGGGGTTYEPPAAAPASRRSFQKYAAGFAVAPDLFLTASSAVEGARTVRIEIPNALPLDATVERTGPEGLALLRVKGQKLSYLNLSTAFAGGAVTCPAFPEISVFGVSIESIRGHAAAPKDQGWKVALGKHPRLPGSPLLDTSGNLVGIELGDREDLYDRLPALSATKIQGFLGGDAPAQPSGNPGAAAVVQITAAFER